MMRHEKNLQTLLKHKCLSIQFDDSIQSLDSFKALNMKLAWIMIKLMIILQNRILDQMDQMVKSLYVGK